MKQQDIGNPADQVELTEKELAQVEGGGLFSRVRRLVDKFIQDFLDLFI